MYAANMNGGSVERIVERFGGVNAMARALEHKFPTTVQSWKTKGFIPVRRHQEVWSAAQRLGIDLKPEDFLFFDAGDAA